MKRISASSVREQTRTNGRIGLLLAVLLAGVAAGALVMLMARKPERKAPEGAAGFTLSESTRAVLRQLRAPVEVRLYSLFENSGTAQAWREVAGRASGLLDEFEREAGGRLIVKRLDEWSEANTQNAAADGIVAQNLAQGAPVYLGVALVQESRKESLAQLAPEWAAALEFDLARAIARVANPAPPPRAAEETAQAATAEETVKRLFPNPAATSLAEGRKLIQDAALAEFKRVVAEMTAAVEKVQQNAGSNLSETERQKALQEIQSLQAAGAEKLREVGRKSQAELEAWNRLKRQ